MGRRYNKKTKNKVQKSLGRKSKNNPNYVYVTCNKCKKSKYLRVSNKKIYTKKILDNYICIFCK